MEYIIGIILLFTFFGLAYYCIKGHNLMIGFLIITLIWTILPLGAHYLQARHSWSPIRFFSLKVQRDWLVS